MAQPPSTLELERATHWPVGEESRWASEDGEEERWPLYKTVIFLLTSSALLWSGIIAFVRWLL